ncbi:MAG: hypothetical protein LUC37_05340 [Prevotella sp.]|nr:hypothetical protein [Prevotella sp.]
MKKTMDFIDSEAKRLFAMPTFNVAKKRVDNDFETLMTKEEHEAEDHLRNELYSIFAEYLKNKGVYNEKRHEVPIIIALNLRKFYHILTEMLYSDHCRECPHLKARYESVFKGYCEILEQLGLLVEVEQKSEVPATTEQKD